MIKITTRAAAGRPLTYAELDSNFNNLNSGKVDQSVVDSLNQTVVQNTGAISNLLQTINQILSSVGSSILGFVQAGSGAVTTDVQTELRKVVRVTQFGAKGDGQTDDAAAFSKAAAYAASIGADVVVPSPSSSYLLNSDPTVPNNINFQASPSWFSGSGQMPFHKFATISEGVNPRIFSIKSLNYSQTAPNESGRKWSVAGWVYYGNAPSTSADTVNTDAVGVDGRGVCDAHGGRVWGLLGLVHITPNAFAGNDPGTTQGYGGELDVNNSSGHDVQGFDSGPITRGLVIASGGSNRPGEALYTTATRRPADNPSGGDNRWFAGWRIDRDSIFPAGAVIYVNDANQAAFARIPIGSAGIIYEETGGARYTEYQDQTSKRRIIWSRTSGYGYDFIDAAGNTLFSTQDGHTDFKQPLTFSSKVLAAPVTLDASKQDIFVLTAGQAAITGGITGAVNGQRLTIWNLSGAAITLSRNANMRTAGGAAVTINNLSCVEFHYLAPTYFQIGSTNNA